MREIEKLYNAVDLDLINSELRCGSADGFCHNEKIDCKECKESVEIADKRKIDTDKIIALEELFINIFGPIRIDFCKEKEKMPEWWSYNAFSSFIPFDESAFNYQAPTRIDALAKLILALLSNFTEKQKEELKRVLEK